MEFRKQNKSYTDGNGKLFGYGMLALVGFGGVVAVLAGGSIHVVRPNQTGLVEWFGRYRKTVGPGLRIIPPWPMGRLEKIPMDLRRCNIPHQWIITKEQLNCKVDAVCYYKVVDPFKVCIIYFPCVANSQFE